MKLPASWATGQKFTADNQNAVEEKINALNACNVLDGGADPTGVSASTDVFTAAFDELPASGGWVYAPSGIYLIEETLSANQLQRIRGDGKGSTVLKYIGTGPCIHAANTGVVSAADSPVGFEGFTVDGSAAGAGAIGLQIGNLYNSFANDICLQNFNTTGGMGLYFNNSGAGIPACERNRFLGISLLFNTTGAVFDTGSFDYSQYEFLTEVNAHQSGVTLQNGAQLTGCRLGIRGNYAGAASNSGWVLGIDPGNTAGTSAITNTDFAIAVESNGTGTGHQSVVMGSALANSQCLGQGVMMFLSAGTAFTGASIHAGSRFGVSGYVSDPVLGAMLVGDALAVQGGSQWSVFGNNTLAAPTTISPQLGDVQEFLLPNTSLNITAFSGTPYSRARKLELLLHQPASGANCVVTWPANIKWSGASGGALSTTNGYVDKVRLTYCPSQAFWYGEVIQHYA